MLNDQDLSLELTKAVQKAVIAARQNQTLSNKIIAWFNELSLGNESLGERDSVQKHMDLLLQNITVDIHDGQE